MSTWVYDFDRKIKSGKAPLKNLLGGKGANLSEMIKIGLPVPPGFTISTEACNEFYKSNQKYPKSLEKQVKTSTFSKVAVVHGTMEPITGLLKKQAGRWYNWCLEVLQSIRICQST